MRYNIRDDGLGLVVYILWLIDVGVGVGLYGQGNFTMALLTLASLPVALLLLSALTRAMTPCPREH